MKYIAFYPQNVDFSHFRMIFCDLLKKNSRNLPILGAHVEELL